MWREWRIWINKQACIILMVLWPQKFWIYTLCKEKQIIFYLVQLTSFILIKNWFTIDTHWKSCQNLSLFWMNLYSGWHLTKLAFFDLSGKLATLLVRVVSICLFTFFYSAELYGCTKRKSPIWARLDENKLYIFDKILYGYSKLNKKYNICNHTFQ